MKLGVSIKREVVIGKPTWFEDWVASDRAAARIVWELFRGGEERRRKFPNVRKRYLRHIDRYFDVYPRHNKLFELVTVEF